MLSTSFRSPVYTIAPEILLEIFTQCLPSDGFPVCGIRAAPVVISQVCVEWRTLIVNSSHFWTFFAIMISKSQSSPSPAFIQLWLKRSAFKPLTFCFEMDLFPPASNWTLITRAQSILNVLSDWSHCWEDARLLLPGSYALLQFASNLDMPRLQSLELTLRKCHPDDFEAIERLCRKCPSLSSFTWNNRSSWGRWDRDPEGTFAPNVDWKRLTHLIYNSSISLSTSYDVLFHCTNLVVCDLRHLGIGDTPSDAPSFEPVFLPRLTTLKIYQEYLDRDLGLLMDFVIAPNLCTLSLSCGWIEDPHWSQQMISLFCRSSCKLETLCLEYTGITEKDLIQCLQANHTSLTTLELYDRRGDACVGNDLLGMLTHNHHIHNKHALCPQLASLTLHGVIKASSTMLARMLHSRLFTHVDLESIGTLQVTSQNT